MAAGRVRPDPGHPRNSFPPRPRRLRSDPFHLEPPGPFGSPEPQPDSGTRSPDTSTPSSATAPHPGTKGISPARAQ
jgi:hypothetical protein